MMLINHRDLLPRHCHLLDEVFHELRSTIMKTRLYWLDRMDSTLASKRAALLPVTLVATDSNQASPQG